VLSRIETQRPAAVALILLGLAAYAEAQQTAASRLAPLALDPNAVTVSGLSSGGAMAVQFHTAHSSLVHGVAVVAAPPYYCAEDAIGNALGRCMKNGAAIPVEALLQHADRFAREGSVDPASGMVDDRVWLYRGAADPHVHVTVADALERYYRARTQPANLVRIEREGAGHNFPTAAPGASPCEVSEPPYVASCGYDAARALLEHLYGPLGSAPAKAHPAALRTFDQRTYAATAGSVSFGDQGWLYVPASCKEGAATPCRLHVVFHGCKQGATEVGDAFVRRSGYLEAAEAGRIVVLFPQLKPTMQPLNPLGCWDWWGYEGSDYATRNGPQIEVVRAMVDDLMGRARTDAANADRT
jgi:poly(3-hydroxybutyrate) depolymerase